MEARLQVDKLNCIHKSIQLWIQRKKATKREVLSLVGLLQHATKVVEPGWRFVTRMYATAAKVKWLSFYTRPNKGFRADLLWWHMFIKRWNGVSFFHNTTLNSWPNYHIQIDASESWGCGVHFSGKWLQLHWSANP